MNHKQSGPISSFDQAREGEYKTIRHDLIRLVILNTIYLAAVLALYFTNRQNPYLENWFSSLLKF